MITARNVCRIIDDARSKMEDIEIETRRFLASCGWKYTCNVPGSLWLYEKELPDGRVALVDHSTALHIEAAIAPDDGSDPYDDDE